MVALRVSTRSGPSIGCRKKWSKRRLTKFSGLASASACGKTSFSSLPRLDNQLGTGLGADADPVDAVAAPAWCRWSRWRSRSPRACRASISGSVELKQRLAAGADDVGPAAGTRRPLRRDGGGQGRGVGEPAAAGAVGADEIGVAEAADGRCPVRFAARSRDCSRRSGRTRPAGRPARLRPGACRRFP